MGFTNAQAVDKVAKENLNVKVTIVKAVVSLPRVFPLLFHKREGSYPVTSCSRLFKKQIQKGSEGDPFGKTYKITLL
jgi:hypothetical protein